MRRKERISTFWNLIDGRISSVLKQFGYDPNTEHTQDIVDSIYNIEFELLKYWNEYPDLRFTQVLVNLGIITNNPGVWYYLEEIDLLNALNIDPREYLLWGQNYDKDMNKLPETVYRPIKDLNTDHIKAIINGGWCKSPLYLDAFDKELKIREDG